MPALRTTRSKDFSNLDTRSRWVPSHAGAVGTRCLYPDQSDSTEGEDEVRKLLVAPRLRAPPGFPIVFL